MKLKPFEIKFKKSKYSKSITWTRFSENKEKATENALEKLAEEFGNKVVLVSVLEIPGMETDYTEIITYHNLGKRIFIKNSISERLFSAGPSELVKKSIAMQVKSKISGNRIHGNIIIEINRKEIFTFTVFEDYTLIY